MQISILNPLKTKLPTENYWKFFLYDEKFKTASKCAQYYISVFTIYLFTICAYYIVFTCKLLKELIN